MGIFDGLPDPLRPAVAFQQGFQQARAESEERAVRGALGAYAINPDDQQAFEDLAYYRPELAIQIREDRSAREQKSRLADLQRRAAGGDRNAMAELAGVDIDAYDKLADNDRQEHHDRADAIGQAALRISQLPPDQRPAAWDSAIDQISSRYPELAEYKGQYSEEALMGAIDAAKQVNDFFRLSRPDYQVIPDGGLLVNTRDPAAVASVSGGGDIPLVNSPEEARGLPPGTEFRTPDGRRLRVPGGTAGNGGGNFP